MQDSVVNLHVSELVTSLNLPFLHHIPCLGQWLDDNDDCNTLCHSFDCVTIDTDYHR